MSIMLAFLQHIMNTFTNGFNIKLIAGFKNTQTVTLVNTALVPMTYQLRVPGDGDGEVVCATSGEVTLGRTNLAVQPKEFVITPQLGTVGPQSEVKIEVWIIVICFANQD